MIYINTKLKREEHTTYVFLSNSKLSMKFVIDDNFDFQEQIQKFINKFSIELNLEDQSVLAVSITDKESKDLFLYHNKMQESGRIDILATLTPSLKGVLVEFDMGNGSDTLKFFVAMDENFKESFQEYVQTISYVCRNRTNRNISVLVHPDSLELFKDLTENN